LLPEFAGQVNLIYIDPPFDTGADFSFNATVPGVEDEDDDTIAFTKQPSVIEQKAYRDTWGRGLDSYLQWFYETVVLLHELLAANGSLYVHLAHHVRPYVQAIVDEVLGGIGFQSEIVWKRSHAHIDAKQGRKAYGNITDILLYYTKSSDYIFNTQYTAYSHEYIDKYFRYKDSD